MVIKQWRRLAILLLCMLLTVPGLFADIMAEEAPGYGAHSLDQASEPEDPDSLSGEWIVKWSGEPDAALLSGTEVITRYEHIWVVQPSEGELAAEWLKRWKQSDAIEYMEANSRVGASQSSAYVLPNDPHFDEQRYLQQIRVPQAWSSVRENADLIIAIVDTGIDLDHPDLKDNLVPGYNLLNPGAPPMDDHGHGTNVAGVVAAAGNNGQGVSGVLWGARMMPVKALGSDGTENQDKLGEGIRYAVDHGARIVVLSLGLYQYSAYLHDVARYAEEKGVLLVAASGNDGKIVQYPAAFPTVLAVGGVNADNKVDEKSNFGPELDVVAPWNVYTTAAGGGYMPQKGTSMAAPQAAAVAAMIWSKYPDMTPAQVRNMLRQTAQDLEPAGWNEHSGYGMLRADRALAEPYRLDMYEPNNLPGHAKPLPLQTMISAALNGASDQDWFYLDSPYAGTVHITIESDRAATGFGILHYASLEGNGTAYSLSSGSTVEIEVEKGRSWIRLDLEDPELTAAVVYRLQTEFRIYADPFEGNDIQFTAHALPARSQTLTGTFHQEKDQDWFVITLEQSGTLRIRVTPDSERMDPVLGLQKLGEREVEFDRGGPGQSEITPPLDVLPGKYYIRVQDAAGFPVVGEYTLSIDFSLKLVDPNEPNDRPFQATRLTFDHTYPGVIHTESDEDWFTFRLEHESIVRTQLRNIPADRFMSLSVLDQQQSLLDIKVNPTNDRQIDNEIRLKPGHYYIRLSADQRFVHQMYELQVTARPVHGEYTDLVGHWAEAAVVELTELGIMQGYGDYRFRPDQHVTRAESVAAATRALKLPAAASPSEYADVAGSHWAYSAIQSATAAGIVRGYPDQRFEPDRVLNRMELAVIMANILQLEGTEAQTLEPPFDDVAAEYWGTPILMEMKAQGYIDGFPDGTFKPLMPASRAEFAVMLHRVLQAYSVNG